MKFSWQVPFAPSAVLMDRLRYAYKFVLIGVLVLVPLGYVFSSQYSIASERIVFNGKEVDGVDYIEPLRDVLQLVERQRVIAVGAAVGDVPFRAQVDKNLVEIDKAVAQVDAVEARPAQYAKGSLGEVLKTTARWNDAKRAWNGIRNSRFASADDVEKAYGDLSSILVDIVTNYAANYSNLILDPDLDSYYLMDAYIAKVPTLGESFSRAASIGARVPPDPVGQADRIIELAGQYKVIGNTIGDLESINMAAAFKEVGNFSKSDTLVPILKPQLDDTKSRVLEADEMLRKVYLSTAPGAKVIPSTLDDHHRSGLAALDAIDKSYLFHRKVGPELRKLCKLRADKYQAQRVSSALATILGAALLVFIFVGFYVSVRRSVDALAAATTRMIAGTTERFELASKDELGGIAAAYNDINVALTGARTLQERVEKDNRSLQQDIMGLLGVVADASDGNLTVRAKVTEGALGNVADAFNVLLESLQKLLGEVVTQISRTNSSVAEITAASKAMESGATTQAKEVKTATQFIQQISGESERVSENALRAADAAKRTESSAAEGAEVVQSVIKGMDRIRQSAQAGAKKVKTLGDRSMEITGIVSTISRISEQTNMLALNAAIEAARAGEYGRGFSVVAEEVRKLAERTAGATQEIDRLVKTIIAETSETVEVIEQQAQVVEEQSQSVSRAGAALDRIRVVSGESATLVTEITKGARAQVDGTQQVVKTVNEVSKIATETQRNAHDAVGTIDSLIKLSQDLSKSVGRFTVS